MIYFRSWRSTDRDRIRHRALCFRALYSTGAESALPPKAFYTAIKIPLYTCTVLPTIKPIRVARIDPNLAASYARVCAQVASVLGSIGDRGILAKHQAGPVLRAAVGIYDSAFTVASVLCVVECVPACPAFWYSRARSWRWSSNRWISFLGDT